MALNITLNHSETRTLTTEACRKLHVFNMGCVRRIIGSREKTVSEIKSNQIYLP